MTITQSFTAAAVAVRSAELSLLQIAQSPDATAAERVVAEICAESARELSETLQRLLPVAADARPPDRWDGINVPLADTRSDPFDEHGRWKEGESFARFV